MKDLYTRLGNSILRAMRETAKDSWKSHECRPVFSPVRHSAASSKSPLPDLKRMLHKEVNFVNQQVYDQLMREVGQAALREQGKQQEAEDLP